MMKIQYDVEAQRQLYEIFQYGKRLFGPQTAIRYKNKVREKIKLLKQYPQMGSIEPLLTNQEHQYRYLLIKPYKVIYSIQGEIIRIHLFWHTDRDPLQLTEYPIAVCEDRLPYEKEDTASEIESN